MERKGGYQKFFNSLLIGLVGFSLACLGFFSVQTYIKENPIYLYQFCLALGFCFSFMIIIHELIHALAYKLVGAKKVYFGMKLSKFMFYAACDQQHFNGVQFRFVALAPFVCITTLCLAGIAVSPHYFFMFLIVMAIHTLCCSGDFAMLNYIQQYDLKKVFTYDLKAEKTTYFYLK